MAAQDRIRSVRQRVCSICGNLIPRGNLCRECEASIKRCEGSSAAVLLRGFALLGGAL